MPGEGLSYSFSNGACASDKRFMPAEPKSTSTVVLSPAPAVASTVPMPKMLCSTRSPTSTELKVFGRGVRGAGTEYELAPDRPPADDQD